MKAFDYFFVCMMALCLIVGGLMGGATSRESTMNEVHDRLSARCEAPAVYSRELLACVEVQP